ncbi:MAG: isoprenylcysteine carboxylmethyltransferase family protein [Nanoarchaeota archaeon]
MIDLILIIIFMVLSIDIFMVYKYKVMHKSRHKYGLAALHVLVLLLNIIFIFYLGIKYYNDIKTNFLGYVFVLIGFLLGLAALRTIKETAILPKNKLVVKGPYKYMRHPIYMADIIMLFGLSLVFGSLYLLTYTIALVFALRYLAKKEEKELVKRFGNNYKDYIQKVKGFGIF